MTTQQITLETMTFAHLRDAVELSRHVGWPHRREDWELMQSLSQGVVVQEEGRVVGTILMTPYGDDAATVNMVIVDAAMRGRGLGRKLMEEALAKAGGRTCYLVATQEGLALYEKLGFVATGKIVQHQGLAPSVDAPAHVSWGKDSDHARLVALDRAAFGHDRSALMRSLRERAKFAVVRNEGNVQAFAAVRRFGRGLVIGPVVGRKLHEARCLIDFLLADSAGEFVRIDTDESTALGEWLTRRGLAHVGGGITMRRTADEPKVEIRSHQTYALVSQALG
ncbi:MULTISPECIES: GNAT family N-acetyltransferase [unclassified Mesorhizobium]|uniref:GNAT family N-acetyltransferase n=1 Tax=unclassified Mesorhizobium TaxID=325217 RepID=UPI00112AE4A7|nr:MULTISPECIES: GNAT family N-acetyltransferase [unclassified Mesorhizobium]MBZ9982395.1 GNAT family N-acetyltransferase [Mesorhizobium sp. BR-1-1-8]TPL32342.1 GNAT family N-acetyltransferase [Mesorhizobium sp. B2-4-8]TPL61078.1 GNAT family N-acetyltransferase [Mesorhizobium sp. B2-4-1]